jgi:hypothetical protein
VTTKQNSHPSKSSLNMEHPAKSSRHGPGLLKAPRQSGRSRVGRTNQARRQQAARAARVWRVERRTKVELGGRRERLVTSVSLTICEWTLVRNESPGCSVKFSDAKRLSLLRARSLTCEGCSRSDQIRPPWCSWVRTFRDSHLGTCMATNKTQTGLKA